MGRTTDDVIQKTKRLYFRTHRVYNMYVRQREQPITERSG